MDNTLGKLNKVTCIVCNRPLTDPLSRKIKCGPKCLKILNEAKKIYQAKNKKYKKAEIKGQTDMFKEVDRNADTRNY